MSDAVPATNMFYHARHKMTDQADKKMSEAIHTLNEKMDEVIVAVGLIRQEMAVARSEHGHLAHRVRKVEDVQDQHGRDLQAAIRDNGRMQMEMQSIRNELTLSIQNAVATAINPLNTRLATQDTKQSFTLQVAKAIGSGGWAVVLLILAAAFTPLRDRLFASPTAPVQQQQTTTGGK